MLSYYGNIDIANPEELFLEYEVPEREIRAYMWLLRQGRDTEVYERFIMSYMLEDIYIFKDTMSSYLSTVEQGIIPEKNVAKIVTSVILLTAFLDNRLRSNMRKFVSRVVLPETISRNNISNKDVQKAILNEIMSRYDVILKGSLSQTQFNILRYIREMQRRLLVENQSILNRGLSGIALNTEVARFRKELFRTFPEYYKAMKEGKFITSRRFGEAGEKIRNYTLEGYVNMAVRSSILDVDRLSVEVSAKAGDIPVVEFYLRDERPLVTGKEREICDKILSQEILGKSILAVTEEASEALGIMTIEEAKNTYDYSMGYWCRHSIKIPSNSYLKKIRAIIRQYKGKTRETNA